MKTKYIYKSQYKSKQKLKYSKKILKIDKIDIEHKTIRIITSNDSDDYKKYINVYIDIFKKLGYKIDIHILSRDKLNKLNIKYAPNDYYYINLFIDIILPLNDYYNKNDVSFFKKIFPADINIFAPNLNINIFLNNKQLHYIDIVLCNTLICYNFINLLKKKIIINLNVIILNLQQIYQYNLQILKSHVLILILALVVMQK